MLGKYFWSSSSLAFNATSAWSVNLANGNVSSNVNRSTCWGGGGWADRRDDDVA
jgi:hypothetical protein